MVATAKRKVTAKDRKQASARDAGAKRARMTRERKPAQRVEITEGATRVTTDALRAIAHAAADASRPATPAEAARKDARDAGTLDGDTKGEMSGNTFVSEVVEMVIGPAPEPVQTSEERIAKVAGAPHVENLDDEPWGPFALIGFGAVIGVVLGAIVGVGITVSWSAFRAWAGF